MSADNSKITTCDVCGKALHRVQSCPKCGKALCNMHLSSTRHPCKPMDRRAERTESVRGAKATKRLPIRALAAAIVLATVAIFATLMLIGGEPSENGDVTEVTSGTNFSVQLSYEEIQSAMMQSRGMGGRQFPGSVPMNGTMPTPFGNRTMPTPFGNRTMPEDFDPEDFMNRTRADRFGFLNMAGLEFLVAIPESVEVENATDIDIQVVRVQGGYRIYELKRVEDTAAETVVELDLIAPTSSGEYEIYYTVVPFSGLETNEFQRTMGQYAIGDLVFMVRKTIEVV